jgi:hypothetical protein
MDFRARLAGDWRLKEMWVSFAGKVKERDADWRSSGARATELVFMMSHLR